MNRDEEINMRAPSTDLQSWLDKQPELSGLDNFLLNENRRLREALAWAGELADATVFYDWIYLLSDEDKYNQLYDASMAWKTIRKTLMLDYANNQANNKNIRME